jgi:hypothetical protein
VSQVALRARLPRDVVLLVGVVVTYLVVTTATWGLDSHAYWAAWRGAMYDHAPNTRDAYLYSPAFAQALWPAAQLPWPVFGIGWSVLAALVLLHLFRSMGWGWAVALTLCCAPELMAGNVFWLLALVAAYGLRHPALWSVALLTKITPGVGIVWFAVRREWRALGIALGVTVAIAVVSWLVSPHLWSEWLDMLRRSSGASTAHQGAAFVPPLAVRAPMGLALLVWAAWTDRRWGIPAAMVLVTPISGIAALVVLAALPRLYAARERAPEDVPLALPA